MASERTVYIEVPDQNGNMLTDSLAEDLVIYTETSNQGILLGNYQSNVSAMAIRYNSVKFSSNIYVVSRIGIATSNPQVALEVNTTDAILIPKGTTAQRPSVPVQGHIRYNTAINTFEGFGAGNAWGSLGGVKDTNQDTYISAESFPTSNDDILRFYTSNNEVMRIMPNGFIGVSNTAPSERLDVSGGNAKFGSNIYVLGRLGVGNSNPSESIEVTGNIEASSNIYAMSRLGVGKSNVTESVDVIGNMKVSSNVYTFGRLGVGNSNPSETVDIIGNTKISNNTYIMSNVGIGTSNPSVALEVNGSAKINSNLEVIGNMTVRGTTTTVDSTTVTIADNIIRLNNGAAFNSSLQAGIEVNRGAGLSNYLFIFDEVSEYFKVGMQGGLQVVATRDDALPSNAIAFFDSSNLKYTGCNTLVYVSGNVGIGTSLPSEYLHVEDGKIYSSIQVLGQSNDSVNIPSFSFKQDSNTGIYHPAASTLGIVTGGVERMRVGSDGAVMVRNTSALAGAHLTVNDKLFVGAATHGGNYTDAIIHIAKSNAAPSMTWEYNGVATGHIRLENNLFRWIGDGSKAFDIANGVSNANPTGTGTSLMRILGSGNIGIGTVTPSNRLDVIGNIRASSNVYAMSRLGIATSNPAVALEIISTDAVLLPKGTSAQRPSVPLQGHIRYNTDYSTFEGYGAGNAWGSLGGVKDTNQDTYISAESFPTSNDDILRFYTSNNEVMRIMPNGFIGVSNMAPSERMEVSGGNAKFGSNIYVVGSVGIGKSNVSTSNVLDMLGNAAVDGSMNLTKHVLTRGLQVRKRNAAYFATTLLPSGVVFGFSNDDKGAVLSITSNNSINYFKFVAANNEVFRISGNGDLNVGGHIIPNSNIIYDLGTSNNRFRDLYLSGNTLYIGDGKIKKTVNGVVIMDSNDVITQSIASAIQLSNFGALTIFTSNNNAGVSVANPTEKLHVQGKVYATAQVLGTSNDSVSVPSFSFKEDSNTGMYHPGTAELGLVTGGNERVRVTSGGNVGIGVSNPQVSLEINATDAILIPKGTTAQRPAAPQQGYVRYNTSVNTFEGYGAGNAWGSLGGVKDTNQDTYISAESFPTSNDDILRFFTSNNEVMRIVRNGFVGVSNTAPSERLDVVGNIKASSNIYAITSVGVGTSNPSVALEVNGSAKVNSNLEVVGNLTIRGTTTTVDSTTVNIVDNIIRLNNGAAFSSSLQAGIEVNRGTGYSNYYFVFDEASDYFKVGMSGVLQTVASRDDSPGANTIAFYDAGGYKFTGCNDLVYSGGRLGVGVNSPTEMLHVDGGKIYSSIQVLGQSNDSVSVPSFAFKQDSNTGMYHPAASTLGFVTGGTERMRIDNSGNIGIGGTPSGYRLDVAGLTRIQNILSMNNQTQNCLISLWGDSNNASSVNFYGFGIAASTLRYQVPANTNNANHVFYGSNVELVRINGDGKVGIATASPTEALEVTGKVYASIQVLGQSNDSASVPSFAFKQDSNTGMYHPAASTLGFVTGGAEKFRVNSTGVGILTNSPSYVLDVNGNSRLGYTYNLHSNLPYGISTTNRRYALIASLITNNGFANFKGWCAGHNVVETTQGQCSFDIIMNGRGWFIKGNCHNTANVLAGLVVYLNSSTNTLDVYLTGGNYLRYVIAIQGEGLTVPSTITWSADTAWATPANSTLIFDTVTNIPINSQDTSFYMTSALTPIFTMTRMISGNVGIGTSNPTQKLQVLGNIQAGENNSSVNYSHICRTWKYGGLTVTGSGGHLAYNITTDNDSGGWRWRFVDNTADAPGGDYFIVYWSSGNYWFKGNSTSDRRIKANIQNISSDAALEKIRNVQPVTYNPKNSDGTVNTDIIKGGFIAQDLQTVIPELVTHDANMENNMQDSEKSFVPAYGVDYNGVLAYNVAATQELIKENEALKQRINNIISFLLTKFPDEEALISCI